MQMPQPAAEGDSVPFLEYCPEPGGGLQRIYLEQVPFRIGRGGAVQLLVPSRQVSKEHAEIYQLGDQYRIRDLKSTNGTLVNGQRVGDSSLGDGDIIHLANKEFRFGHEAQTDGTGTLNSFTEQADRRVPPSLLRAYGYLKELLANLSCQVAFQPIVDVSTGLRLGYEALGRGVHPHLGSNPKELFQLAEQCGLAAELSRTLRYVALEEATTFPPGTHLFLNLHPHEMGEKGLLSSLKELSRRAHPYLRLVMEVNEAAVTDSADLFALRDGLKALGIGLAYDDFGVGQARYTELIEVPPDFVKLDMGLVRGIHQDQGRQQLVRAIGGVIRDLGIKLIAEGIETQAEAAQCEQLGCHYCQGYFFGRPQVLTQRTLANFTLPAVEA